MPIHLQPTAPLAERVLLPGDPGRALLLAQTLLDRPRMFNHNRGLWGYTGAAADGEILTIQSTGMGGPSAAIVISELADLGARRLVRVGTCGALDGALELGELVIAAEAIVADGASRALNAAEREYPDAELLRGLVASGSGRPAVVVSTDLFYDSTRNTEWIEAGAQVVEMETAALFTLARTRGVQAASVLIVSDKIVPRRVRIDPEPLRAAERVLGELAVDALSV